VRSWKPGQHVYVINDPLFLNHIANECSILGEIHVPIDRLMPYVDKLTLP
jgi:hypothetical protein